MPTAFRLLCVLLAAIPVLVLIDDWIVQDISSIVAALMMLLAIGASEEHLTTSNRLLKKILLAILFPIGWMIFQIAPLGIFTDTIWPAASNALNESLWGSISIDSGATLRSLFSYLTMVTVAIATMVFTMNRERAEMALFVLCAVTFLMSVEILLGQFQPLAAILAPPEGGATTTLVAIAALGALANTAAAARIFERRASGIDDEPRLRSATILCLNLAGAASCLAAIMMAGKSNILIVSVFGIGVILLIGTIRLMAPGPAAVGVMLTMLLLAGAIILVLRFGHNPTVTATLQFATSAPAGSLSVTRRALSDARWFGSGVGTFDTLTPIYRDFEGGSVIEPASTVAKNLIEWGRAAFVLILLIVMNLCAVMFSGAVRRGRDWFFSASACASVLVLFCEAFCDASLIQPSIQIIAAVIIGLGLSQTIGRTSGGL